MLKSFPSISIGSLGFEEITRNSGSDWSGTSLRKLCVCRVISEQFYEISCTTFTCSASLILLKIDYDFQITATIWWLKKGLKTTSTPQEAILFEEMAFHMLLRNVFFVSSIEYLTRSAYLVENVF